MVKTDQQLQTVDLSSLLFELFLLLGDSFLLLTDAFLLAFDLRLLLFERVDEDSRQLVVLYAFYFALLVTKDEQRFHSFDFFGSQPDIVRTGFLPVETDRAQAIDDAQPLCEGLDISLVTQTRLTAGNLVFQISTKLSAAGRTQRVKKDEICEFDKTFKVA